MSYRNPTIVNDQSGAVLGQAIAQGAQNIAKGIIGMEAQNRAAKERAAKQAEKDERKTIADANAQVAVIDKNAKDRQAQYDRVQKNMKNAGDNFQILMEENINLTGQLNIDFINNKSPEKIQQIKEAKEKRAELNEFMTDFGAYLPEASTYSDLAASDILNNTSYTSIGGDDGTKAKKTLNAMMGSEGYGYDLEHLDGKNYLKITSPDGKSFNISQNDLKSIGKLSHTRKESGPQEMQNATKGLVMTKTESGEEMNTSLFATDAAKKGPDGKPLIEPIQKTNEVDPKGYKINRQKLDANKINQILVPEQLRVVSKIGAFRNNGERDLFLRDYRISPTVYDKATPEEQNAMIESSVKDNFLQTYNMKERDDEYFTESRGEKVSETDASKKDVQLGKVYKKYSEGLTKLNEVTTAEDAVKEIYRFANLGTGATISRGSSNRFATNKISLGKDFVATITIGDGEGDYDSTQTYDLKKIEEAENFIRNKTGIYDPTQLDALATALSKKANSFSN
tara:strand:+ start:589 stop:2118 length:1530 start_codon:yes stop_codon:yes gene_type:complete